MDDTRIQRRMRPRPYDLRRKVLLKNFLKDQMTHRSEISVESFNAHKSYEESFSSDKESAIAEVDQHESSFTVIDDTEHNNENSFNDSQQYNGDDKMDLTEEIDVVTTDNFNIHENANHKPFSQSPNLVKFTGLLKKDSKSAFKAKKFTKTVKSSMKTRSFKRGFERVFYGVKKKHQKSSSSQMPKNSSRSLFSLFKHRKEHKHVKKSDKINKTSPNHIPNNVPMKSSSVNQSVQTDDSWVREEMNRVHESNQRLIEENRLLSESLSYFMSNATTDSQVRQSSYQPSYENENNLMFQDYSFSPSSSNQCNWNPKSKVFRSKSVHEFSARHKILRNNYRTKSMNVHNSRNYFLSNSQPLLSSYTDEANIPRIRKKRISTNVPNSSSNRGIQRRSSMPERTLVENNRWVTRTRSNSMRNTHTRKPFYALSADAFY